MVYFKIIFTYKAHWIIRRTFLFLENVTLSGAPYSAENTVQKRAIKRKKRQRKRILRRKKTIDVFGHGKVLEKS